MTTPEQFDAVVIGSGQGGTPLSLARHAYCCDRTLFLSIRNWAALA